MPKLNIITGKNHYQIKLLRFRKVYIWAFGMVGTSNQIFTRGSQTETKFFEKIK